MRCRALCAVALLAWIGLPRPLAAQMPDWTTLTGQIHHSVLRVMMQGAAGAGVCSAVVFDITADARAHALTAAHCVSAEPNQRLDVTVDGRTARTMVSNTVLDLAVVQFRPAGLTTTVILAPVTPPPGSPILAAGYAFGVEEIVYQFGYVAQTRNKETKALWMNLDILFGDSGGAILDAQGRLIGVTSFIYSRGPAHIGGAVSIEDVKPFLDDYRDRLAELEKDRQ